MHYVKLTTQDRRTFNGTIWTVGEPLKTSGKGNLCGPGWLHCYGATTEHQAALLATLLNPIHADFYDPMCWRIKVDGASKFDGMKFGFSEMTLIEQISLPEMTMRQCVKFAILCVLEVYDDDMFSPWAERYLNDEADFATKEDAARWKTDWWISMPHRSSAAENAVRAALWAMKAARRPDATSTTPWPATLEDEEFVNWAVGEAKMAVAQTAEYAVELMKASSGVQSLEADPVAGTVTTEKEVKLVAAGMDLGKLAEKACSL
jgi:hypothetical protein